MATGTVRARLGVLERLRKLDSMDFAQQAEAIGVDPSTLWRIANSKAAPSAAFIAGVTRAHRVSFDAVFEVVDKPAEVIDLGGQENVVGA